MALRFFSFLCMAGVLSGCGVTMIQSAQSGSKYAPQNEGDGRTGVVTYIENETPLIVKYAREQAYKKMWAECIGKYRINHEWTSITEDELAPSFAFLSLNAPASATQYRHIAFQCLGTRIR